MFAVTFLSTDITIYNHIYIYIFIYEIALVAVVYTTLYIDRSMPDPVGVSYLISSVPAFPVLAAANNIDLTRARLQS